jgi:hypothetical protein
MCLPLLLTLFWLSIVPAQTEAQYMSAVHQGIIQNPVVSCQDVKKKILCLPIEYSKFDLPYRNEHNLIDIGKSIP